MYDVKYGGTLIKGDMIAVARDGSINIGFYVGISNNRTLHYYELGQLHWAHHYWEKNKDKEGYKFNKPTVYYVYPNEWKVMKISPDVLTNPEDLEYYEKALLMLKELKIRK
jgi:hypothetical protein